MLVQQVKEGHQVNSLGEVVLLLLNGEVGEQPEEGVLPLLLGFLTQTRKNAILMEIVSELKRNWHQGVLAQCETVWGCLVDSVYSLHLCQVDPLCERRARTKARRRNL